MESITSESLLGLRKVMTETYLEKTRIAAERKVAETELSDAKEQFKAWDQGFFMKRVYGTKFKRRVEAVETASAKLEELNEQFRLTATPIEIEIDAVQAQLYFRLRDEFAALMGCKFIWDRMSDEPVNKVATRSTAARDVFRERVKFSLSRCNWVEWTQEVPHLVNRDGGDLFLFPGFVLCGDSLDDFAIIEFRDIEVSGKLTRFLEEEIVPEDSKVVGHTWKMVNKDGSPDLRFRGNRKIPIVQYADLHFTTPTGLDEAYQFSNVELAERFLGAWSDLRHSYE